MQLETIFIVGQVIWEMFLIIALTGLLCLIYEYVTRQSLKTKNK